MTPAPAVDAAPGARRPAWYHEDNGFSSRAAMDQAHEPILCRVRQALAGDPVPHDCRRRVLDLGCGNGALVATIARLHPGVVPAGVDVAGFKIDRARQLLPPFAAEFTVANMFDREALAPPGSTNFLAILMLGRLLEVPPERSRLVLGRLRRCARHLLVYAYEDYVRQTMPLAEMAANLGLRLLEPVPRDNVGFAWLGDDDESRR